MADKDYTELDAALLARIANGATTFAQIRGKPLEPIADALAGKDSRGEPNGWRLLDRRLQVLRKKGELTYDRARGWAVKGKANG